MTSMAIAQTPAEVTDEALVAAARAGDRAAYSNLVARYRDLAFAYAFARLRDREEAEDVAQEAFVRAYLALDRFRMSGCWSAWLMRIVRNLCTDVLRKRLGRKTEPVEGEWLDDAPTPEMVALAGERRRELRAAVAELPEKYRMPLLMHYGSGRTYREIAVALDLPESTIVGRMAGALRLLRRRMGVKPCLQSRLCCALRERALARWAARGAEPPAGSSLAAHLAHCAECRQAWEELRSLAGSLSQYPAPYSFPGIYGARLGPHRGAGSAGAGRGGGALRRRGDGRRSPVGSPPIGARRRTHSIRADGPGGDPDVEPLQRRLHCSSAGELPVADEWRGTSPALPPDHSIRLAKSAGVRGQRARSDGTVPRGAVIAPGPWASLGARAEAAGDYELAAVAYGRAYDDSMEPSVGLAAGRAAEVSGDTAGAVEYFAQVLRQQAGPIRPGPQPGEDAPSGSGSD